LKYIVICYSEGSFSRVSSAGDGMSSNVKVVVRVRPFASIEVNRGDKTVIEYPGDGGIWVCLHVVLLIKF